MPQDRFMSTLFGFAIAILIATILTTAPVFAGAIGFVPASQEFLITEGDPALNITYTFVNGAVGGVTIAAVSFKTIVGDNYDDSDKATGTFVSNNCDGVIAGNGGQCTYKISVTTDKADSGPIDEWEGDFQVQLQIQNQNNPYIADAVVWVSDVQTPSPEPATITLLGVGCVLVGARARRRRITTGRS